MRAVRFLVCLVLAVAAGVGLGAERRLVIESFEVEVGVGTDGALDVQESIRVRFIGAWNGLYRTIPIDYRTDQGFRYRLRLDAIEATGSSGQSLRVESSRERHYRKLKIWVPDARDTVRLVRIRYRVANGLKFFDEHDELYWNVTGDEWDVPIEAASARISLPAAVSNVRATAFTGGYGSRERAADLNVGASVVTVRTTRELGFREGLTVAVAWDPGAVARPTATERTTAFVADNAALGIPVIVFFGMLWLWHARGRDPAGRPIAVQYEPPDGLTPAELGTLVDDRADMRDITATLVHLAVKGFIKIEEIDEPVFFGLWSSKDYRFTLQKPWSEWSTLAPHERKMLSALFERDSDGRPETFAGDLGYAAVRLGDLENRFYKDLPGIHESIYRRLVDLRLCAGRPDRIRTFYLVAGLVLGAVVAIGAGTYRVATGFAPVVEIVAGALTAVIVGGFGRIMPVRTLGGARAREAALGFEEFLRKVEADRFERVIKTPELFEKFLPYAMALGVDRNWARAFEDICTVPPSWYRGQSLQSFHSHRFVADLGRLSSRAASVMTSAPRSSGGSGIGGGGGHSGGGFGGGGGGGF